MTTYFAGALRCIQRVAGSKFIHGGSGGSYDPGGTGGSGVLVGLVSLVDLVALVGLVALLGAKLQFSGTERDEF